MPNVDKSIKDAKKKLLYQLLQKGITSNHGLKREMKRYGHKISRKTIQKYKQKYASASSDIKNTDNLFNRIPEKTVKKIIKPHIKKAKKKFSGGYYWYTPPCPGCKRCYPISSNNHNEGKMCIQCGYEFVRDIGEESGHWKKKEPRDISEKEARTNIKFWG